MPDYHKVITVDGNDFVSIMNMFSDLVHDKFHKPVPYRDFTRLKKYNKEVQFRFADDGAVMIVPTESSISLLYWTKKDDNSLGDFLWGYFQEELKEMHPDEKKIENCYKVSESPYKYDLWGNYDDNCSISAIKADCATSVKTVIDDICSDYRVSDLVSYDMDSSAGVAIAPSKLATCATSIHGDFANMTDTIEMLKARVEELGKMVQDNTAELHETAQEIARTSTKSLEEAYLEMEAKLAKKVDISEMEYRLEDRMMDMYAEIDEARYDTKELNDRLCELEDNLCPKQKEETVLATYYDVNGVAHEVPATMRGTSSNCYPVRNYKIDFKADYMSACDNGKEKESMDTAKMFNFDFGPVASHIRMSPYGLAMKNADGKYVSYDKETGSVMDVEIFNFDAQKFLYKMPVAVSQVAVGDIVVHMRKPMFVRAVKDGVVSVIDIYNAEAKDILPVKSPFGFNFITKVVSLIDMTGANANSPFGNMLPLLMLGEGQNFKDILPLMLFANGSNGMGNFTQNPLMLYALMKDGDGIGDVLPFLMMGQNGLFNQAPAHNCGCHNHEPERQCHDGN